ncbi:kinesin-like protein KIN-4C isoform X1 [Physcomitrium patens]|uniref:kinesin-like protein KIN-4C isoform X1 n=1 Tax=Physcomitrium patens TaxID=3218 RepID=UPI000D17374C|nr:kinesin-like protein KIN-4C isoform X1 [Physcomitrium patens]XP_024400614.1 kinesin-like protein KIN-4C isoform X1 [Physcomitrium patens]XP_024400615.1 kinesin-like protein KIN-4C isoform X1 [Physcomitrium patens]|eukprot:XP_024400613.1 kinesin-like protein KIN-4C isoform X1 [Physcomitrella patens]
MVMENGVGHENEPFEEANVLDESEATQAVQVALNIRPLIPLERVQGCNDCITVVPGEPQVQIGHHSFTFDYVFGRAATPLPGIFDKCVKPLVEGLFHGYNATVLAYGQTGSGKTYTMGTGYTVGGSTEGVIPQVMQTIFKRIETLKHKADFQLRVSFIEILKEEIHDLLDPNPPSTEYIFGGGLKALAVGKPPIQIRETTAGGITLMGVTEADVKSLEEMAAYLEHGSLSRATGSTNMNSHSSRSHAIFTITLEQRRKWDPLPDGGSPSPEDCGEDYLCAKLHLVDLAGSERAKRTGADGLRFKEGVHINRGLLALGNVISALGDEKKRREGGHVPYRDSKLTRLLQDSLGGNSRTVMIACVSPADVNAEESINTLKYANRARNIRNKPTVNRDPLAAEMQRMRQQLELMQAELLCARAGGPSNTEVQMLKQKVAWLEASNMDLRRELEEARERIDAVSECALESQVERDKLRIKLDQLRSGKTFQELDDGLDVQTDNMLKEYVTRIQELECELQQMQHARVPFYTPPRPPSSTSSRSRGESTAGPGFGVAGIDGDIYLRTGEFSGEINTESLLNEFKRTSGQGNLDKQLRELDKRLERKQIKLFVRPDGVSAKQHLEKKMTELEEDKNYLQTERDNLLVELESNAQSSDKNTQKFQEARLHKLKSLKVQIAALNNKQEAWSQYLRQQQCSDGDGKRKSKETHEENEPQELQMWSITTGLKGFFQEFMPRNLLYSRGSFAEQLKTLAGSETGFLVFGLL